MAFLRLEKQNPMRNPIYPKKSTTDGFRSFKKLSTLALGMAAGMSSLQASTDYGPAIWNPLPNFYTTGNGHLFLVIHDMEGFYGNAWSTFNANGTSVHFAVNSGSGTSSGGYTDRDGKPAGEISQ